jgi:hypothetical protein
VPVGEVDTSREVLDRVTPDSDELRRSPAGTRGERPRPAPTTPPPHLSRLTSDRGRSLWAIAIAVLAEAGVAMVALVPMHTLGIGEASSASGARPRHQPA